MEGNRGKVNIEYVSGDATHPHGAGVKLIVHICNNTGKWGKGFVLAVSKRWTLPETVYRQSFKSGNKPELGDVQFIPVEPDIIVANLIGQDGVRSVRNAHAPPPIRYSAVLEGLQKVGEYALTHHASVHMPRIGCGLAGGRWEEIEKLVQDTLIGKEVPTSVYDFVSPSNH